MDHRVEPPAWLPQGAAPEAADPEADETTATEDAQQAEDSNEAPAEAAEEFAQTRQHRVAPVRQPGLVPSRHLLRDGISPLSRAKDRLP